MLIPQVLQELHPFVFQLKDQLGSLVGEWRRGRNRCRRPCLVEPLDEGFDLSLLIGWT